MYLITVTAAIPHDQLDRETDDAIAGTYLVSDVAGEEEALDYFHENFGISVLDDFEIGCQRITPEDPRIDDALEI